MLQVNNEMLYLGGHKMAHLHPAKQMVEIGRRLYVVRFDPPPSDPERNRNIVGYDGAGNILWRIAECPHGGNRPKPYMHVKIDRNIRVIASNWIGADYFVDLTTGAVTAVDFDR
ncbi:MAG: hypothetical protein AAB263_10035 [Planctomycetota bacterium]